MTTAVRQDMMIMIAEIEFADDPDLLEIIVEGIEQGRLVIDEHGLYHALDA